MYWVVLTLLLLVAIYFFIGKYNKKRAIAYIQNYTFSDALINRFKTNYPNLTQSQIDLVQKALKEYFTITLLAKNKIVAMPSVVVDELWHQFLLFSKEYETFCKNAFGKILYHTPNEAMPKGYKESIGLKRTWQLACKLEKIDPNYPDRLPLLFYIDQKLDIKNGKKYSLYKDSYKSNCNATGSGGCGGSYIGDFSSDSSGDSGCGSGCGGCGGG